MGTIETSPKPTFQEALAVWAKIGVLSFGGPAGQIALMPELTLAIAPSRKSSSV